MEDRTSLGHLGVSSESSIEFQTKQRRQNGQGVHDALLYS